MTTVTSQNALSTSAEEIFVANKGVSFREVKNADASISVYLGSSNAVSSSNGHLVKAGESFSYTGGAARQSIWAIAASGTPTVTLLESN